MSTLSARIDEAIARGDLVRDDGQAPVIATLDRLLDDLSKTGLANKKSALGWLFGGRTESVRFGPRGAYVWGGVGRGKSMLMDHFFDLAAPDAKRRVHFHAFMQDVHARIHAWRQLQKPGKEKTADPIFPLADDLSAEAKLLCFDEFSVTDAADAMILARLFTALFERGVSVVATSNVEPDELYRDGLNRSFFLPFIGLIHERMDVVHLGGGADHRMERIIETATYFIEDRPGFENLWSQMIGETPDTRTRIDLQGRSFEVDCAADGVARVGFDDLCRKPLGSADYLALTGRFHTLFMDGLPIMNDSDRNAAKRFITLIDILYEAKTIFIACAQGRPEDLYPVKSGTEAFEFRRTVSRLNEMQGRDWLMRS